MQILVSNNRYRLGNPAESRMRPHMEEGLLGIVVVGERTSERAHRALPRRQWREWTARSFTVEAGERIPAGIDGEAVQLEPPLTFRTRPRALNVRIARTHPGASRAAIEPDGTWDGLRALAAIAAGRIPGGEDGSVDTPEERRNTGTW